MSETESTSRRSFLKAAGAATGALAAPAIIPASALGQAGRPAPSERIVLASIGWGMQGPPNTGQFMQQLDCQVVALCDLDDLRRQRGIDQINEHYGNQDCKGYVDYRELFARDDLDAVMIAVPDHWHALLATEAAERGLDIYGEKPLAHTFAEQQAIVKAVQKHQRIWQTGSWQRSQYNFRLGAEIVRNGHLGTIRRVEVGLPSGHTDFARTGGQTEPTDPPPHIHYEMWLGPAQWEPYIPARHHLNWRWNYNIGGGQLLDWIGHHGDIAHWGLGDDDKIGPLEVEGTAEFPPRDAVWHTTTKFWITCRYPGDIEFIIASNNHDEIRMGTKWVGDDGWVYVDRNGKFEASDPDWSKSGFDTGPIKLYESRNHWRNFLDSIKSRQPTVTPVEVAHRSTTPGHLGYIATVLGRKIRWDPKTEQIINDHAAYRMLSKPMRAPWTL